MINYSLKRSHERHLFIFRILSIGGFFLIPAFGVLYSYTNPKAYDPWPYRIFLTCLSLAIFFLTYIKSSLDTWLTPVMYSLFYLTIFWILLLLHKNSYNPNYLLGFLLVVYLTSLGFLNHVHLMYYFLTLTIIFLISIFTVTQMEVNNYVAFITIEAMFLVSYFIQKTKVELETSIENKTRLLEEKNKDITDSINYAKRIQDAIIPSEKEFTEKFSDSFVLYQPKDVVSGDFYLLIEEEDKIYFCVGDCTGHGVPGAFMSMIGHSQLNHIILEKKIKMPSLILQELNKSIKKSLKQKGASVEDGMDIAFCVIDKNNNTLEFAGAKRPLWIINRNELKEITPDKTSIGGITENEYLFTNHSISLEKGSNIYLFSDGFADQFGEKTNKKLMIKTLKKELLSVQDHPMVEQKNLLMKTFNDWKGKLEQVDDVLVIGIKLNF